MNVLSLFDGMSCGQIALQRLGVKVEKYLASEIDKYAIKVTQAKFPNTIQLGDVTKINPNELPKIDLLIGGSPCQGFSSSGKRLNFDDPRSKLFFEFVRLLKCVQPKYFLLENVKMKQEFQDIISYYLDVKPIEINSSLVSAQNRVRLYWTNIPNAKSPNDKGVILRDILEEIEDINPAAIRGRKVNKATIVGRRLKNGCRCDYDKSVPIIQCLEVRATNIDKSNCLTTVDKDNVLTSLPPGRYIDAFSGKYPFRYYTLKECCRLQTVSDNYFDGIVSQSQARKMLGKGWTVDVIVELLRPLLKECENSDFFFKSHTSKKMNTQLELFFQQ